MAYSRVFVALKEGCKDYAKDIRGCVGRAILEIRNGRGRLLLQAQGLKSDNDYRVCVLGQSESVEVDRPLYVDRNGRGEIKWEFRPDGVLSDIRALAVLVKDKAPLIGFVREEYNWQQCLIQSEPEIENEIPVMAVESTVEPLEEKTVEKTEIAENAEISEENKSKLVDIVNQFTEKIDDIQAISLSSKTTTNEDYIFNHNGCQPFGKDDIQWVRASVRELSAIKDLWKYGNNPFVQKSCRDHKHILLGRDNKNYWLGLPCTYGQNSGVESQFKDFQYYKAPEGQELEKGKLCYCLIKC